MIKNTKHLKKRGISKKVESEVEKETRLHLEELQK
jgi:hypothetical protein